MILSPAAGDGDVGAVLREDAAVRRDLQRRAHGDRRGRLRLREAEQRDRDRLARGGLGVRRAAGVAARGGQRAAEGQEAVRLDGGGGGDGVP